ncbi:hypothetical protein C4D60_Mb06t30670 [Musa balbisiana]|uniref:Uncharacterized protein n=1 Tax=Musa balbisiana TaxID=52838 RepID=A0A4S8IT60_MUSBA|nr:hypothetical protein C4D60_Mb06t30670 [Musa balbisiana]
MKTLEPHPKVSTSPWALRPSEADCAPEHAGSTKVKVNSLGRTPRTSIRSYTSTASQKRPFREQPLMVSFQRKTGGGRSSDARRDSRILAWSWGGGRWWWWFERGTTYILDGRPWKGLHPSA